MDIVKENQTSQIAVASDGTGSENKLRKVRLKVGGVTRTIHTKSSSDGSSVVGTPAGSDSVYPPHKPGHQVFPVCQEFWRISSSVV